MSWHYLDENCELCTFSPGQVEEFSGIYFSATPPSALLSLIPAAAVFCSPGNAMGTFRGSPSGTGIGNPMDKKYRYGEKRGCVICQRSFRPKDRGSNQKCCSNACRGVLQTWKATKTCAICGEKFLPTRPRYETCSRSCGTMLRLSRRKIDPMVGVRKRLAVFCCALIARCLRNKSDKTASLLGYSVEELRTHLEAHFESWMSWRNYGKGNTEWSIDHSRPISSFPASATLAEINALENLRPMCHRKNCAKKNKWAGR